jgi:hypothetical protein
MGSSDSYYKMSLYKLCPGTKLFMKVGAACTPLQKDQQLCTSPLNWKTDFDKNVYVSKVFKRNKGTQHQMFQWVWFFPSQMFHYIQIFIKVKCKAFHMSLTMINDPFVNVHVNFFC